MKESQAEQQQDLGKDMTTAEPLPRGVSVIPFRPSTGEFAVSRRLGANGHEGLWQFPGGHVEPGESALDAACRELREETGLEVPFYRMRFLGETGPLKGYKGDTYIGERYLFDIQPGEVLERMEPTKATAWQWVTPEKLQRLAMLQETKSFALGYFAAFNARAQNTEGSPHVSDAVTQSPHPSAASDRQTQHEDRDELIYRAIIDAGRKSSPSLCLSSRNGNDILAALAPFLSQPSAPPTPTQPAGEDMAMLDWLNRQGEAGMGWMARKSTRGRGFRLHQDPAYGQHPTPREAIRSAMQSRPSPTQPEGEK